MAHSEKHGFDAAGARRVVQLGIAVGYIADADECGLGLCLVNRFLEAGKSRHAAEGEFFSLSEAVGCGQSLEESGRVLPLSCAVIWIAFWRSTPCIHAPVR